jgi:NTE family protein
MNTTMFYPRESSRIGLACAGGVVEGAFFEIGVLCALEEAVAGLDLNRLHIYVGVSSGSLITACLANGIPPRTMARAILSNADPVLNIRPEVLFTPARKEYLGRLLRVPQTLASWLSKYVARPFDISLFGSLMELGRSIPVSIFDNQPIEDYLRRALSVEGRTNDFRALDTKLRVVAVDLDSSELVVFGEPSNEHVPISQAVQASTALPILYGPVEIEGRFYIDGVARRTLHASHALSEGADLLFCVNPIVPVDLRRNDEHVPDEPRTLVEHGLPAVLSQTFRTIIHSRMRSGFKNYEYSFPNADIIMIEPEMRDHSLFFTNIFSFRNRHDVCEHAYRMTRRFLSAEADRLQPVLERHGLRLRRHVLEEDRTLFVDTERNEAQSEVYAGTKVVLDRLDRVLHRLEDRARDRVA